DPRSFAEVGRPGSENVTIARYSFRGPTLAPKVQDAARAFRPDIVHCYEPRVASFAAGGQLVRTTGGPLCVHFADDDVALFRAAGSTSLRRAARPLLRQG